MSSALEKIEDILADGLIKEELSTKAWKKFSEIRKQVKTLNEANETLQDTIENLQGELKDLTERRIEDNNEMEQLRHQLNSWAIREKELIDREFECRVNEVKTECAELRIGDHQSMFSAVFRNSVLRNTIMETVSRQDSLSIPGHTDANGYSTQPYADRQPTTDIKDTTTTKEET